MFTNPYPTPPVNAPIVVEVGEAVIACNVTKHIMPIYNPPELARPEEPAELTDAYLLLPSKGRWVPLVLDQAPHLIRLIHRALDKLAEDAYAAYAEELKREREL